MVDRRGEPPAAAQASGSASTEESEFLRVREEMQALRAARREAMQAARESADPQAIASVHDEFRPRMEALRARMREQRMGVGFADDPQVAAQFRGLQGGRPFECDGGPGRAPDHARQHAFQRLRRLAPSGTLEDPAAIPAPVRQELEAHARRVARLQCIRARARANGDDEILQRTGLVLRAEQQRHRAALRGLLGAPPATAAPAAPTPAPAEETTGASTEEEEG